MKLAAALLAALFVFLGCTSGNGDGTDGDTGGGGVSANHITVSITNPDVALDSSRRIAAGQTVTLVLGGKAVVKSGGSPLTAADVVVEGLPAGVEYAAARTGDTGISVTLTGTAPENADYPLTVCVKTSALAAPQGFEDSAKQAFAIKKYAPNTASIPLTMSKPISNSLNTFANENGIATVTVMQANKGALVLSGTKTAVQTVTIGGANADAVEVVSTDTAVTLNINADSVPAAGGVLTFTFIVNEDGKAPGTARIDVKVLPAPVIAVTLVMPSKGLVPELLIQSAAYALAIDIQNHITAATDTLQLTLNDSATGTGIYTGTALSASPAGSPSTPLPVGGLTLTANHTGTVYLPVRFSKEGSNWHLTARLTVNGITAEATASLFITVAALGNSIGAFEYTPVSGGTSQSATIIQMGQEYPKLKATTTQSGTIGWHSSNPTVADISEGSGTIELVAAGVTEIYYTVDTATGVKTNSKTLTVYRAPLVDTGSLRYNDLTGPAGASVTPVFTYKKSDIAAELSTAFDTTIAESLLIGTYTVAKGSGALSDLVDYGTGSVLPSTGVLKSVVESAGTGTVIVTLTYTLSKDTGALVEGLTLYKAPATVSVSYSDTQTISSAEDLKAAAGTDIPLAVDKNITVSGTATFTNPITFAAGVSFDKTASITLTKSVTLTKGEAAISKGAAVTVSGTDGKLTAKSGSAVVIAETGALTVSNGANFTAELGSAVTITGALTIAAGTAGTATGATITVNNGGVLDVETAGGAGNWLFGATVIINRGGVLKADPGFGTSGAINLIGTDTTPNVFLALTGAGTGSVTITVKADTATQAFEVKGTATLKQDFLVNDLTLSSGTLTAGDTISLTIAGQLALASSAALKGAGTGSTLTFLFTADNSGGVSAQGGSGGDKLATGKTYTWNIVTGNWAVAAGL